MENTTQDYGDDAARRYTRVGRVDHTQEQVERGVNQWLYTALLQSLPRQGVVGDFGCGSGRLLPALCGEQRKVVGVDSSRAMLDLIPLQGEAAGAVIGMAGADVLAEQLRARNALFIEADLQHYLPLLGEQSFRFDAGVSSFNAVCFSDPAIPVTAIGRCLRSGAPLFFTSNAIVPSGALPETWEEQRIAFDDPRLHLSYPSASHFRHVLHTQGGDVPLQDHVHHMGMLQRAFNSEQWRVEDACIFPAEGCEHLPSSDTRYSDAYKHSPSVDLLEPDSGFTYVKIGVRAHRKE